MVAHAGGRKAVVHLMEHYGVRKRRVGQAMGYCRLTARYLSTRSDVQGLGERMIVLTVNGVAQVTFARLKRLQ